MDHLEFQEQVRTLRDRIAAWNGAADSARTSRSSVEEAEEELNAAMEQLRAAEAELHRQLADLQNTRAAFENERRRYYDLFHFAPDGYLVTDLDGVVREANASATALLRVSERFLLGKPLALFVAPEDRRTLRTELMRCLGDANRVNELPIRLQPRSGRAFEAALTVAVVGDRRGRPSGLRWLVRKVSTGAATPTDGFAGNGDATPHALFEQAPRGMGRLSLEGRWLAVNQTLRALLGYDREELLRLNVQDVTHPDDRGAVAERLSALKAGEVPTFAGNVRWRHKDGRTIPVHWRAAPLIDPSGERAGCVVTVDPVGDGAPAETVLQTQVNALTDADRRKDEFLAMLAHELRNPLAPLSMSLQILGRGVTPGSAAAHAVDIAEHQVQKLTRLVNELLDVARIRQGKTDLRMERVDLAAVATAAVETVRPLLNERLHTFQASLPPAPIYLRGDAVRLEQVLTNLLTNAAKYTEPGGRISLRVDQEEERVIVRIRDTGVGMVPDLLTRIFEPFAQAEQNLHRARGGLGLGLSLVKCFVELHGGTVEAHSDGPGRGSEFVVRLPASPDPTPERATAPSESRAAGRSVLVLVVDDNRDAAESLAQLTRIWGCEVETAYDGPSAVAAAGERPPDVVFMDLNLPGMDGYETARRLREAPKKPPLLVALTGFGGDDERARTEKAGFHSHLLKPVDLAALKELIARVGGMK